MASHQRSKDLDQELKELREEVRALKKERTRVTELEREVYLHNEARRLPASDLYGNLRVYKELLDLHPEEKLYQQKVDYYTDKLDREKSNDKAKLASPPVKKPVTKAAVKDVKAEEQLKAKKAAEELAAKKAADKKAADELAAKKAADEKKAAEKLAAEKRAAEELAAKKAEEKKAAEKTAAMKAENGKKTAEVDAAKRAEEKKATEELAAKKAEEKKAADALAAKKAAEEKKAAEKKAADKLAADKLALKKAEEQKAAEKLAAAEKAKAAEAAAKPKAAAKPVPVPTKAATTSGGDTSGEWGFKEGDVIPYEDIARIKAFLPEEIWAYRDFVFYEGMELKIGPSFRDYTPSQAYKDASARNRGKAKLGPDGSLNSHISGAPFDAKSIDCAGDPLAGTKLMWNFDYQWEGDGANTEYMYSYWDRGERLPLYYEGISKIIHLSHRSEPVFADQGGDLLPGESRKYAFKINVNAPFDSRGIALMTYRYKTSDGPLAEAVNDDTYVYIPNLRRVRRIATAQRTDAVSGTDFTLDDIASFGGIVPQYNWKCLGKVDILAPANSRVRGYPYVKDQNFGPRGLSFANDTWEMRHAYKVRFVAKNLDHPYHHKDIYIDIDSSKALYSFAYDQKKTLWKILYHAGRWSEDDASYYYGWAEVPEPRDLRNVGDVILNVQTGTGNRIEYWDTHGTPYVEDKEVVTSPVSVGKVRKEISLRSIGQGH